MQTSFLPAGNTWLVEQMVERNWKKWGNEIKKKIESVWYTNLTYEFNKYSFILVEIAFFRYFGGIKIET